MVIYMHKQSQSLIDNLVLSVMSASGGRISKLA